MEGEGEKPSIQSNGTFLVYLPSVGYGGFWISSMYECKII
jgi:hypothetical protein